MTDRTANPLLGLAALVALMAALAVIFLLLGVDPRCGGCPLPWTAG